MRPIRRTLATILLSIFLLSTVAAATYDLSDYPAPFIDDGEFDAYLVVGDTAPASDVVSAIDIANRLQLELVGSDLINVNSAKLASEVDDPYAKNTITIGRACENALTARLLRDAGFGKATTCNPFNLQPGEGIIKLLNLNGRHQLIAAGRSPEETRKAAEILGRFEKFDDLDGDEVVIKGKKITPPKIVPPKIKVTPPVKPVIAPTIPTLPTLPPVSVQEHPSIDVPQLPDLQPSVVINTPKPIASHPVILPDPAPEPIKPVVISEGNGLVIVRATSVAQQVKPTVRQFLLRK